MQQWVEQLGLLGVFLAGATPWFEAVAVIPIGILLGLSPIWVSILAFSGNFATIFLFAYAGDQIRSWIAARRIRAGRSEANPKRRQRAEKIFNDYGIFGMAIAGPLIIGTQFAAAIAVGVGVKPFRASIVIGIGMILWGLLAGGLVLWII